MGVDFVLDPVRTARTTIAELDKVEKTFIGLKIEHFLRDWLDVPKGARRDLIVDGIEAGIKNSIRAAWMIPPETYSEDGPCLLIATAKFDGMCSLGLIVAREAYLNPGLNRDQKRSIGEAGRKNIMWLVQAMPYPQSRWLGIDMQRFRELRQQQPGAARAAQFFRENIGRIIHRTINEALLHDQHDYMKRLRKNGGARDQLESDGLLLLSGAQQSSAAIAYGYPLSKDEFVAVRLKTV